MLPSDYRVEGGDRWVKWRKDQRDGLQDDRSRRWCGGRPATLSQPFREIKQPPKYRYKAASRMMRVMKEARSLENLKPWKMVVECTQCKGPKVVLFHQARRQKPPSTTDQPVYKRVDLFEDSDEYWRWQVSRSRRQRNLHEIYDNWLHQAWSEKMVGPVGAEEGDGEAKKEEKLQHHYRHHVPPPTPQPPPTPTIRVCALCPHPFKPRHFKDHAPHKYTPFDLPIPQPQIRLTRFNSRRFTSIKIVRDRTSDAGSVRAVVQDDGDNPPRLKLLHFKSAEPLNVM